MPAASAKACLGMDPQMDMFSSDLLSVPHSPENTMRPEPMWRAHGHQMQCMSA